MKWDSILLCGLLYALLLLSSVTAYAIHLRKKLVRFSDALCKTLDDMISEEYTGNQEEDRENLFYKVNHRLARLYEIMVQSRQSIAREQADLQELISDISHQVKTPISNLKMVNATLMEQPIPEKKRQEFLRAANGQLDKLDFLMQAMIKTSRLETGIFSMEKKLQPLYGTLAVALGGILLSAEKKKINVSVDCPQDLTISHDSKWTGEALFNILDNAVKYTPTGGRIRVSVQSWELYAKIDIQDTGKGIAEGRQGMIFQRFYREAEVHDTEGIGIGLYLAREIITMQSGYIKVDSRVGKGSTFSVFLPRE